MEAAIIAVVLIVVILLWIFLVVMPLHDAADSVPTEYQLMTPSSVFLLFIPLFNVVWLFFVVIRISKSLTNYFQSKNVTRHGTCGSGVGLAWAICSAVSTVPYIGSLVGIGALVCMIIYLVKISGCKRAARKLMEEDDLAAVNAPAQAALQPPDANPGLPSPEDG